ncbi:MAG TPA: ABC transporter substrate-binding protein [Candidatus Tectomicrobia bacterium]|nr:ABC transporter substrate-binding protein [Candidatus Tectomicrobia bacterium]
MWSSAVGCIVPLILTLLVAPLATTAQPRGHLPRVGVLEPTSQASPAPCILAFQQGLRELGYVEGQSILLDYRYGEGQADRLPALAAELVQLSPDVLWLHSDPAAWAARRATTSIPIVIGVAVGLVEQGLVASLAQPSGNLTGLELPPIEVAGKRLELFKDAVPTISRVAVLVDPAWAGHALMPNTIEREAEALGVQLQRVEAGAPAAFEAAFAAMVEGSADALMITESALFAAHRQQLLALALRHRLPTMAYGRHWAEAGSLLAYGADPRALCQRSAVFVHKILRGVKPADLPIERATFELVVNLKAAAALGVTVPPTFLFQADAVIK